jgi:SAM-dependent methyltransferase
MNAMNAAFLRLLAALAACLCSAILPAQDFPQYGDELYRPRLRQPGKDVMWLPTPDAMVTAMRRAAKTTRDDIVYDLGSGDGRIPIAAAKEFGAQAVGIEYDGQMVELARRNAERAGVGRNVTIVRGDIFKQDFSRATVVAMYLLPDLNQQLRPQLLKMKPGTRVVSYSWDMGEWEPDEVIRVAGGESFLWLVPANVEGRWALRDEDGFFEGEVVFTQRFQRIGGTLASRGTTQPLLGAYVQGEHVGFTFVHPDGSVRVARARVEGNRLNGTLLFAGTPVGLTGRRL